MPLYKINNRKKEKLVGALLPLERILVMQINKHGSFYIRNGWPTKIIDTIDKETNSTYIFSPNNELQAVDQIGVGRVMIKALRYWSAVLGITLESKTQQGVLHTLSNLGRFIAKYDPYCQRTGTLWLLHRNLACNEDEATAWAWAFNMYAAKSFSKESFVEGFYSYIQTNGGKYTKTAMEKEFDCFKNTYVSDKSFDIGKILDEDTVPFFAPLNLLVYLGNGTFEKRRVLAKEVPPEIFFFCILSDNAEHLKTNTQINIDTLLEMPNQVGKYMNLGYSTLLELLQQLENKKWITLVNNFGNRYIEINPVDAAEILKNYYKGIEE